MSFRTYKLATIQQAVDIGLAMHFCWFRGHSCVWGELTPGVFRPHVREQSAYYYEDQFGTNFRLYAPAIESRCPNKEDYLAWLFLMQHHRTPTRLLDWSESVLVALFFAVTENHTCDAEIWVMKPGALNQHTLGIPVIVAGASPQVAELARHAFNLDLTPDESLQYPIAVLPTLTHPRFVSQLSAFTIHPFPVVDKTKTIVEALDHPHLVRYIVDAANKPHLAEELAALGITHRTLFPDLEGLSKTVVREEHRRKLRKGERLVPPPCNGEVS